MKKLVLSTIFASLVLFACKSGDSKKASNETSATNEKVSQAPANEIPDIDTANLKTESDFYNTWETFTSARQADENKKKADKNYKDHYLEYLKMYTKLLAATTKFSKTFSNPLDAVAFDKKVNEIQNKMYPDLNK